MVPEGEHILVVDDEEPLRCLYRLSFQQKGYCVSDASDGEQALELARRNHVDLIILDVRMPTKDGWDVLSELREDPDVADVPVVMLTAQADEATEWRARELGAAAYIAKPVNLEDLLDVVVRVLAISR